MASEPLSAEELDAWDRAERRHARDDAMQVFPDDLRRVLDMARRQVVCLNARCSLHRSNNTCGALDLLSITTSGSCNMWECQRDDELDAKMRGSKERTDVK